MSDAVNDQIREYDGCSCEMCVVEWNHAAALVREAAQRYGDDA